MLDGGNNYGSHTWSGGTIGGAMFGLAGPLAARTTYGVTAPPRFLLLSYNQINLTRG